MCNAPPPPPPTVSCGIYNAASSLESDFSAPHSSLAVYGLTVEFGP